MKKNLSHPSIDKFLKCLQYAQSSSTITRKSIRLDHNEAKREEVVKQKKNYQRETAAILRIENYHATLAVISQTIQHGRFLGQTPMLTY